MATIHVSRGATTLGAFPEEEVREGLRHGRFVSTDLGWREGMANWQPLSQFSEFASSSVSAASIPPPPQQGLTTTVPGPAKKTEPLAIWAFVLSIVSLFCCGFVVGIPAVICGHLALSNIAKTPTLEGRGFAVAGLVIGYLGILFWLVYVVFFGGAAFLQGIREGMSK